MKKTMKKAVSMLMALGMLGSMCGTISADNGSEYPEYLNMDGTRRIVKEGYDVELNIMVCRTLGAKGDINENWRQCYGIGSLFFAGAGQWTGCG